MFRVNRIYGDRYKCLQCPDVSLKQFSELLMLTLHELLLSGMLAPPASSPSPFITRLTILFV